MNEQEIHDAGAFFAVSRYSIEKVKVLINETGAQTIPDDLYVLALHVHRSEDPRHYTFHRDTLIKLAVDLIMTATDDNDR